VAAYVGSMAPCSKVTIACAFQAADEMRRVNNFSYRLAMLTGLQGADAAKAAWTTDPVWQPMRKLIEELLTTYDWGEAFAALNLAVKPQVDGLLQNFALRIQACGHHKFAEIILSLLEDSVWHREWSSALSEMLIRDKKENESMLRQWTGIWEPKASAATSAVVASWQKVKGDL
jgi:toluene monooxygenase system protein E